MRNTLMTISCLILAGYFYFSRLPVGKDITPEKEKISPATFSAFGRLLENEARAKAAAPQVGISLKLIIRAIDLNAEIIPVPLLPEGKVDVPLFNVGWYNRSARAGEKGNMSLDGHFKNQNGGPGVFYSLSRLKTGDEILISNLDKMQFRYKVTETELTKADNFPLSKVYGKTEQARLNLITCAGEFDQQKNNYPLRTIVYARLED